MVSGETKKGAQALVSYAITAYKKICVPDLWGFETYPDLRLRTTGLRIRILLFSSVAFTTQTNTKFFAYYLLLVHLHQSSKLTSH